MKIQETELPDVFVFERPVYRDDRGLFAEVWRQDGYVEKGLPADFVQDNFSFSRRGVLRGLHFQSPRWQGKLISVLQGEIFDVAVDLRPESGTFGQWMGVTLSRENARQVYVPERFAHGFVVTSETATVLYKCTAYYAPGGEYGVRWDDPEIGIAWPVRQPVLSEKDASAPLLRDLPADLLGSRPV